MQNDPLGQYELGNLYYDGLGLKKDIEKALDWYNKAADNNCSDALYKLGEIYEQGKNVKKNIKMALKYYKKIRKIR